MVVKNFEFSGFLYRNINIDMFKLTTKQQHSILLFLMKYCVIFPPRKIMDNHLLAYVITHVLCLIFISTLFFSSVILKVIIGIVPLLIVIGLSWCVDENGNNIFDKIAYFYINGMKNHPITLEGLRETSHIVHLMLILMVPVIGFSMVLATFILRKIYECYPEIKIPEE